MKKIWLLAVSMVLVLAIVGLVGCSSGSTSLGELERINISNLQEGISVSGQGKVTVVPDIAILRLGIESQQSRVVIAQTLTAKAMDGVMTALTQNGVAKNDIRTQQFSIRRITKWDRDKEQELLIGYRVTNVVTAKIRNIDKAGTIIDAVAVAGGDLTRIDSISFSVDDPLPYYEEAREKAMLDAKSKAEQVAELADVKLGKPIYISVGTQAAPVYQRDIALEARAALALPAVETSISPGETEISLSVHVEYAIK